jgi:hypothetical protein
MIDTLLALFYNKYHRARPNGGVDLSEEEMPVSATLKLTRETFGIELRRGTFEITIDDRSAGSIKNNETVDTSLDPGHHTLQLRAGRYSSQARSFDVAEGTIATFHCHGATIWPTWLASFVKPDLAISLRSA